MAISYLEKAKSYSPRGDSDTYHRVDFFEKVGHSLAISYLEKAKSLTEKAKSYTAFRLFLRDFAFSSTSFLPFSEKSPIWDTGKGIIFS